MSERDVSDGVRKVADALIERQRLEWLFHLGIEESGNKFTDYASIGAAIIHIDPKRLIKKPGRPKQRTSIDYKSVIFIDEHVLPRHQNLTIHEMVDLARSIDPKLFPVRDAGTMRNSISRGLKELEHEVLALQKDNEALFRAREEDRVAREVREKARFAADGTELNALGRLFAQKTPPDSS